MTAGPKKLSSPDFNGLKGVNVADPTSAQDAATKTYVDTGDTNASSRANHTGTQLANTISNFDTQVRTSRLDQMAAPTASVPMNSQKITGLLDPASAQDAATMAYVDAQLAATAAGLVIKGSVRAAAVANVTIATPGATIDGLTAASGEIFLLTAQSTGSQNGPYVFNGSGSAMTRALNWNSDGEAVLGSFWDVREGTNADTFALLTNDTAITVGTTTPTFVFRGGSVGATGYTVQCGAITAGNPWTITHNLNTRYVIVQIARVGSPYDIVDIRVERTSVNVVTAQPDVNLSSGEFEAMVMKVA